MPCDPMPPPPHHDPWHPTNAVFVGGPPPVNAAGVNFNVTYEHMPPPPRPHHVRRMDSRERAHVDAELHAMRVEANLRRFTIADAAPGFERIVLAEGTHKHTGLADSGTCSDVAATGVPVDAVRRELDAFAARMHKVQGLFHTHSNLKTAGFVLLVALPISIPLFIAAEHHKMQMLDAVTAAVIATREAVAKNRALAASLAETGARIVVGLDADALSAMFASAELQRIRIKVVVALDRPLALPRVTIPLSALQAGPAAMAVPPAGAVPVPLATAFPAIPLAEVAQVEDTKFPVASAPVARNAGCATTAVV